MSITDMFIPGLTFNKEGLGRVGKDVSYNMIAYIIIGLYALGVPLYQFFTNNIPPASGFIGEEMSDFGLILGLILGELIGNFLQIFFIALVGKFLFKVDLTFDFVLRVFAAVMVWYYISFVLGIFINLSFGVFAFLLIFNIALLIGLLNVEGLIGWKAFLTIILGYILAILTNMIVSRIIIAIF